MKRFLLSLPSSGLFCRGFFNRTDVRPPPHTYRSGWTPDGSARCAGWRWRGDFGAGGLETAAAVVAGSGGASVRMASILLAGSSGAFGVVLTPSGDFRRMDGIRLSGWTSRMDAGEKRKGGL